MSRSNSVADKREGWLRGAISWAISVGVRSGGAMLRLRESGFRREEELLQENVNRAYPDHIPCNLATAAAVSVAVALGLTGMSVLRLQPCVGHFRESGGPRACDVLNPAAWLQPRACL